MKHNFAKQSNPHSVVSNWFGDAFTELHPLLQTLHLHGGQLTGAVNIQCGNGIAGFIGRRLAQKLGVPTDSDTATLTVDIAHSGNALLWNRTFQTSDGSSTTMRSTFTPVGSYPDGYWREATGRLELRLGVDKTGGGWRWIQRGMRLGGVPLLIMFLPSTRAYKTIEDGQYRFEVAVHAPLLGEVLRYGGLLQLCTKNSGE